MFGVFQNRSGICRKNNCQIPEFKFHKPDAKCQQIPATKTQEKHGSKYQIPNTKSRIPCQISLTDEVLVQVLLLLRSSTHTHTHTPGIAGLFCFFSRQLTRNVQSFFFCCIAELAIKPCRSSRSKLRGEFWIPKHLQNRKPKTQQSNKPPKPKTQHKTKRTRQVFGM